MRQYKVELSKLAKNDFGNIISYIKYNLSESDTANKNRKLIIQKLEDLKYSAGSMRLLEKSATGHVNMRKYNCKNYIIFYIVDESNNKAFVVRIRHSSMEWKHQLINLV